MTSRIVVVLSTAVLFSCQHRCTERPPPVEEVARGQQRAVLARWYQCGECSSAEARAYLAEVPPSVVLSSIETPLSQGPSASSRRRFEVALQVMHKKMEQYVDRRGSDGPSLSDWPTYRDRSMRGFVAGYEIKACWTIEAYADELMAPGGTAVRNRVEAILRSKLLQAQNPAVRRALARAAAAINVKLIPQPVEALSQPDPI